MLDFNQTGFSGGIITPRAQFSENDPLYHESIKDGLNMVVTEQGSIITRSGSQEVGQCQDGFVRLFRLPAVDSPSNDIIVEVGDTDVAVWVNDVREVVAATPSEWIGTTERIQTAYDVIGDDAGQANTGRMIMVHPSLQPKRLYRDQSNMWQFVDMHSGTLPVEWSPSNYPQTVGIFQNRVWYVGSPVQRTYFWASEAGVLENIDTSMVSQVSDPIQFTGIMEGTPTWVAASSDVFTIGSTTNEYQLVASSGITVTAATALLRRSSTHGSSSVQGHPAEEQVMFTSRNRSKLHAMNYVRAQNNWLSAELSSKAQHLFTPVDSPLGKSIRDIKFSSDAGKVAWVLLDNGDINCCCFDKTTNTTAWTRFEFTGGKVLDMATAFNPDSDYFYISVERTKVIGGVQATYTMLEKVAAPRTDWRRADAWVEASVNVGGEVTNLDRYIGQTAVVFSEFGLEAEVEVTDIGQTYQIQFYDSEITYYVGYKIEAKVDTLTPATGQSKQTLAGSAMRSFRTQVSIYRSIEPHVDGEEPDDRDTDEDMDDRSLDLSVNKEDDGVSTYNVSYRPRGWDSEGRVSITVEQPFICEIVGIFSEIKSNKI